VDLTDTEHGAWILKAAEALSALDLPVRELRGLEETLSRDEEPVALGLVGKLALSRGLVRALPHPVHTSVVLAMYREHLRILPASEHPQGEDFLRRKLRQLRWLFRGTPHRWDLTLVDDGCPEGSGALAREIIRSEGLEDEARVLFLEEAIQDGAAPVRDLRSTDDSRKGGSIRYGLWRAETDRAHGEHVVLFTDADLSTHLGQTGLLLEPIVAGGAAAAIGSRREPTSVVVKQGARNTRGKLFIYLWKGLIPELSGIVDTQCGFKAFRAGTLQNWYEDAVESGFAFDIEMLLQVQLQSRGPIAKVPVAWIDSDALSTTADLEPYLDMLRTTALLYRTHLPAREESDALARLIEGLDQEGFDRLLERIPPEIADAEPSTFDAHRSVAAEELARRAGNDS
jgi:hypothetical protein